MTLVDVETSVTPTEHLQIVQFLGLEAQLLDENRLWEWFDLLAEDFEYEVPIRVTRPRETGEEHVVGAHHAKDTKGSTRKRVERLYSGHAWAEDPASRTTRTVGSIYVAGQSAPGEFDVKSSLTLYRERGLTPRHDLLCGQRSDVIRLDVGSGPRLVRRTVRLSHTILATSNLGIFL